MTWHSKLALNNTALYTVLCEIPSGMYTPPFDLQGKTVLDVGATCGEVAYWLITEHHAAKAVCIENDPVSLPFLQKNAAIANMEVVAEDFNMRHLTEHPADFIKCDVEGYEMILLEYLHSGGDLPPTVVEVHTNWIRDQFLAAGFKVAQVVNDTHVQIAVYVMNNYSREPVG